MKIEFDFSLVRGALYFGDTYTILSFLKSDIVTFSSFFLHFKDSNFFARDSVINFDVADVLVNSEDEENVKLQNKTSWLSQFD